MRSESAIEPGVLENFRFFVVLMIVFTVIKSIFLPWAGKLLPVYALHVACLLLLAVYLSLPQLRRILKVAYLPLAIIFLTILIMLMDDFSQSNGFLSWYGSVLQMPVWRQTTTILYLFFAVSAFSPALFIVLVLVSWQYRYRYVVAFILLTLGTQIAAIEQFRDIDQLLLLVAYASIPLRTAIFLFVGYMMTGMMTINRQQRRLLIESNLQATRYAAMAETLATSRERNRLARELHDTLAHSLTATSIQLEVVDSLWETSPEKARSVLRQSLTTVRDGLKETRRALQELRAAPLEDLGLALALRELGETTGKRSGSAVAVRVADNVVALTPETEQLVYRIAQEALENTVRHAQAKHVSLDLRRLNGSLKLEIVDDGVGFDVDTIDRDHHYGIRGMVERSRMFGGQLKIDSHPGAGTRIQFVVKATAV